MSERRNFVIVEIELVEERLIGHNCKPVDHGLSSMNDDNQVLKQVMVEPFEQYVEGMVG